MRVDGPAASLSEHGFQRYDLATELAVDAGDPRYVDLVGEFDELPPDPYAPASGRYRRYGQGILIPWTDEFRWLPPVDSHTASAEYFQGDHNPEFAGVVRAIPALTARAERNSLLRAIIRFDFGQTWWNAADSRWPLHVGVHFVKLAVDHDGEAVSSPAELHQDGEPFTFAHLLFRRNAVGGGNVIAEPSCRGSQPHEVPGDAIRAEFELTAPLDSYGIVDHEVSHYVAPIARGPSGALAERAVILVDFTVLAQRI